MLPECNDDAGQNTGSPSARLFSRDGILRADEYIPLRMPHAGEVTSRGNPRISGIKRMRRLSAAEREHLELLIWWDDHRDLRAHQRG